MINGDSLCRWPLARLLRAHRRGRRPRRRCCCRSAPTRREFGGGVGRRRATAASSPSTRRRRPRARRWRGGGCSPAPTSSTRAGSTGSTAGPAEFVADLYQPLLDSGERIAGVETRPPLAGPGDPGALPPGGARAPLPWPPLAPPVDSAAARGWRSGRGSAARRSRPARGSSRGARLRRTLVLPGARVGRAAVLERLSGRLRRPGAGRRRGRGAADHPGRRPAGTVAPAGRARVVARPWSIRGRTRPVPCRLRRQVPAR